MSCKSFVIGAESQKIDFRHDDRESASAKELDEFDFKAAAVEEGPVRSLADGVALDLQRNAVPVGGTGTGKTHPAVRLAHAWIRAGRRGRFFNTVDLVNRLDAEARAERPPAWTFLFQTSSADCRSPVPAGSCCSCTSSGT